jgi:hypothetical protein
MFYGQFILIVVAILVSAATSAMAYRYDSKDNSLDDSRLSLRNLLQPAKKREE